MDKNNKLVIWNKKQLIGRKCDVCYILEDNNGLRIELTDCVSNERINISYSTVVCSYRNIGESFAINWVEQKIAEYGLDFIAKNTFFLIENSTYAKLIQEETHGAVKKEQLFHLEIVATDSVIDIVSFLEPEFYIFSESDSSGTGDGSLSHEQRT